MLTDHIAILLYNSLDQARINRLSPTKPPTFFAQIAFPPSAGADLQTLVTSVAPGGQLAGLELGVHVHSSLKKPFPGIPADWLIARSSSQFAPTLMDQHGQPVVGADAIKALFYPGRRIRGALTSFPWAHSATNRKGVSFNLAGVMDAGPGERLAIGDGVTVNEFQKYATAGSGQAAPGAGNANNPFAGVSTAPVGGETAAAANPFGGAAATPPANNPFAQ